MTIVISSDLGSSFAGGSAEGRKASPHRTSNDQPRDHFFAERVWWQMAIVLLAGIPVVLLALAIDPRLHNDVSIWIKPLKFQISMALHLITLAVLVRMFSEKTRRSSWITALAVSSSFAALVEITLIGGQAARGVGSHFNTDAPMDNIIYAIMGVGSLILILPALIIGIRFLASKSTDRMPSTMKLAAGSGLLLSFVFTLTVAGYMSMQGGHWVEAPTTDANGLPVVGWTRQGGDLRVAHFFATHIMQVVPIAGWLAVHRLRWRQPRATLLVGTTAVLMSALALGTFVQALNGQAFI
ncbi:MAG: hypothetical protein AAF292_09920 [Pseudomonadota bacterium]